MINQNLSAKAQTWGKWTGQDMAKRQGRRQVVHFFSPSEVEINAKVSSHNNAIEYHVATCQYPEWEQIFVAAYSTSYRQAVAEWKEKEAIRLARFA